MPYKVGAKGSYGCSGYPAVKEGGEVMGCHKTRAEAAAQIYAINISEGKIGKSMTKLIEGDFVMCPEGYEDEPLVGRVEYVMTEGTFGMSGSEYAIEASVDDPAILVRHFEEEDGIWEEEMILSGHKQSMLIKIESLMVERDVVEEQFSSSDSEVQMAMYDSSIGKASPCWDGYVQRGMKPGKDGKPVPNCVPVEKSQDTSESFFNFRNTKPTRNIVRLGE